MRIFDTVSESNVTLIDVRAGLLSSTLHTLRNIEFIDSAKKGQLTFVVFHILGSSLASLNEIADLSGFTRDCKYFLVKNFINEASFFEWHQATHSSFFKNFPDAVEITIPKLNERFTNKWRSLPSPSSPLSPTRTRMVRQPIGRLFSAVMFDTG
jgi:hypothetical protein